MLCWDGGRGLANGLKCSSRAHNDLERVVLQHFFSELAPEFRRGAPELTEGFKRLQGHDEQAGQTLSPAKQGRSTLACPPLFSYYVNFP